jgi:hypothetical protein
MCKYAGMANRSFYVEQQIADPKDPIVDYNESVYLRNDPVGVRSYMVNTYCRRCGDRLEACRCEWCDYCNKDPDYCRCSPPPRGWSCIEGGQEQEGQDQEQGGQDQEQDEYCANCEDINDIYGSYGWDDHSTYHFLLDNDMVAWTRDLYRSAGGTYVRKEVECLGCGRKYDFLLS